MNETAERIGCSYYTPDSLVQALLDSALDVWGVHGVGGALGVVLLGVFASLAFNPPGADGLTAGNSAYFMKQLAAVAISTNVQTTSLTPDMLPPKPEPHRRHVVYDGLVHDGLFFFAKWHIAGRAIVTPPSALLVRNVEELDQRLRHDRIEHHRSHDTIRQSHAQK